MRHKNLAWACAALALSVALTSCNIGKAPQPTPDVNGIYTSAAQTMVADLNAQQSQTAAALPPTSQSSPTPLASPTAFATFAISTGALPFGTLVGTPFTLGTPGTPKPTLPSGTGVYSYPVGCNDATFIGETKPYDKAQMDPLTKFDKGWSMSNSGTCTWDTGYSFNFKDGDKLSSNILSITISNDKNEWTKPGASQAFVLTLQSPKSPGEYKGFWQMKDDVGNWFGSIVYVDIIVVKPGADTPTAVRTP